MKNKNRSKAMIRIQIMKTIKMKTLKRKKIKKLRR